MAIEKTVINQLLDAQLRISDLTGKVEALAAEKLDMENKLKAAEALVIEAKAKTDADVAKIKADAEVLVTKAEADVAKIKADLDVELKNHATTKTELDTAKARLANPGFEIAGSKGTPNGESKDGGVIGKGGNSDEMSQAEAHAAYNALGSSEAKTEFRKKNWKVLGIEQE